MLIAPAAFKGTLSAREAAEALAEGARRAGHVVDVLPIADGGEGTLDVLGLATHTLRVTGAWGEPVDAAVGVEPGRWTIELARICGFDPARLEGDAATTRGVGEALAAALREGAPEVRVTLGGSATTDGGAGLLVGLGAAVLDRHGRPVRDGGASLGDVVRVVLPAPLSASLEAWCDVAAPLCGPMGAARLYGPQKGATIDDDTMARWADVVEAAVGRPLRDLPGAGAAGGTGLALAALGARLLPGAERVLDALDIDTRLARVDAVLTGEGRVDAQSRQGKAPFALATRTAARGLPVYVVAGALDVALPGQVASVALGSAGLLDPVGALVAAAFALLQK